MAAPTYVLAPGTFLPCAVETKMNSEVEGYFTAKVNQNVYDSATHTRLLVPQGSTILGHDNSSQLVYGNERMDTISLTLIPSGGTSVDLGNAPVTDEQGVAGLTGDVDQHYWRLFGAVFIGGALKGGMQAMQTADDPGGRGGAGGLRDCHLWQSGDESRRGTGTGYPPHDQGPCRPTLPRVAHQRTEAPRDVAMTRLPDETASARGAPAVPPERASWLLESAPVPMRCSEGRGFPGRRHRRG